MGQVPAEFTSSSRKPLIASPRSAHDRPVGWCRALSKEMDMASNNAGIVKLGTNNYRIRVRATCPRTGRRKEVERVRECTLTEARALQHQWQGELAASLVVERAARQRLKDFAASWLAGRKGKIKRSTAQKIVDVWDGHIANAMIADLYIDEITIEDVEAWIEELRAKVYVPGKGRASSRKSRSEKSAPRSYSPGTIKGYYVVLRQIIKAACARTRVPNPCEGVEAPTAGKSRKNFLGVDEVGTVLAFIKTDSPDWYAAVLLDVLGGLRWGELSALRFDDLDETEGVIRVRRGNDKGRVVNSTKTGDDDDEPKLVPLLPVVAEVLRERRQQMVRDQHPGLAAGWIFPTKAGGLHKGSPLRDVLDRACAACRTKRRITPHGLRHTANDLLRRVAGGEVVRAIIGHSTPQMTSHYSHVDENEKRLAATRVLDVVTGGKGGITGGMGKIGASESIPETSQVC